ncbi:hypothetical protein IAD21_03716 [Abditibacteriota bacterium]|nr:hypothetical protein IAD21_03716 [Abditibacteriota bacterium]
MGNYLAELEKYELDVVKTVKTHLLAPYARGNSSQMYGSSDRQNRQNPADERDNEARARFPSYLRKHFPDCDQVEIGRNLLALDSGLEIE